MNVRVCSEIADNIKTGTSSLWELQYYITYKHHTVHVRIQAPHCACQNTSTIPCMSGCIYLMRMLLSDSYVTQTADWINFTLCEPINILHNIYFLLLPWWVINIWPEYNKCRTKSGWIHKCTYFNLSLTLSPVIIGLFAAWCVNVFKERPTCFQQQNTRVDCLYFCPDIKPYHLQYVLRCERHQSSNLKTVQQSIFQYWLLASTTSYEYN